MVSKSLVSFSLLSLLVTTNLSAEEGSQRRSLQQYRVVKRPKRNTPEEARQEESAPVEVARQEESAPVEEIAQVEEVLPTEDMAQVEETLSAEEIAQVSEQPTLAEISVADEGIQAPELPEVTEASEQSFKPELKEELMLTPELAITTLMVPSDEVIEEKSMIAARFDDISLEDAPGNEFVLSHHDIPGKAHGFNFEFEALVLKPHQEGLDYGIQTPLLVGGIEEAATGPILRLEGEYRFGFRMGIGYHLPADGWNLSAQWMHYKEDFRDATTSKDQQVIIPYWLLSSNSPEAMNAFARWDLTMNVIDFEFDRRYYIGNFLAVRPHGGLRISRIEQDFNVNYDNIQGEQGGAPDLVSYNYFDHKGYGLVLGINTDWKLSKNILVYSRSSLALLYSEFHINRAERFEGTTQRAASKDSLHTIISTLEFSSGLSYTKYFSNCRYFIKGSAGWEHQIWLNENQFLRPSGSTFDSARITNHGGTLSLTGASARLTLGF